MLPQGLLQEEAMMGQQAPQEPAMPSPIPTQQMSAPPMQGQPKNPQMIIDMLLKLGMNPQALQSPEGQQLLQMLMK